MFVGVGGPKGCALDHFNDNAVGGNTAETIGEVAVEQAFLPHAPQHPIEAELGEVGANLTFVLALAAAIGVCA